MTTFVNDVRYALRAGRGTPGVTLIAVAAAARMVAGLLFAIGPTDPVTFVGAPLLLLGVAALGCCVPARRALGIDPIVAMRAEYPARSHGSASPT